MGSAFSAETVILALNSGSSSLKVALYSFRGERADKLASGEAQEIGTDDGHVEFRRGAELVIDESRSLATAEEAAEYLIEAILKSPIPVLEAVGHRVVHGGPRLREHQRITPEVLRQLTEAIDFAPLHLPRALSVIHQALIHFPEVPHIACFDTAFHRTIPEHAAMFALSREFWDRGLRRYGFHGLSCESIVRTLGNDLADRTVVAHLGSGCSITAIRKGVSIETTMGLTPTGGVMMGTRSGDLDPGVLLHLLRVEDYKSETLDTLLNHEAGLFGVSGLSSDMRHLLQAASQNGSASLAIEMFCYQVRKAIGAMAAVLGGVDLLVFTGGIGEHAAAIRAKSCSGLEHLQIVLDAGANQRNASIISSAESKCLVRAIEADEDLQIARHSQKIAKSS